MSTTARRINILTASREVVSINPEKCKECRFYCTRIVSQNGDHVLIPFCQRLDCDEWERDNERTDGAHEDL